MTHNSTRPEPFFGYFAWFILLFVTCAFVGKAVFDTADLPPLTPLHHFHAAAMGAWFVLFAVQPTLIQLGKNPAHRLLGRLSPILVLTFLSLALAISQLNWERIGDPLIIAANSVNLTLFLALYLSAIAWRRAEAAHKRLMLYATLSMLGPAAGRIPEIFDQSPFLAIPIILVLNLAPVAHDFVVHRRVHPATWIGFGLLLASIPIIVGLSGSDIWAVFLARLLGPPGGTSG